MYFEKNPPRLQARQSTTSLLSIKQLVHAQPGCEKGPGNPSKQRPPLRARQLRCLFQTVDQLNLMLSNFPEAPRQRLAIRETEHFPSSRRFLDKK